MKSALLLLCLGMLGCAGVCCGQTVKSCPIATHPKACKMTLSEEQLREMTANDPIQKAAPMTCAVGQRCITPPSEPMDIPAINDKPFLMHAKGDCWGEGLQAICTQSDIFKPTYTCADKSRVLLTAEDQSRHCIKFPK